MALTHEQQPSTPKQVVDQSGRVYRLGKELGTGGQGNVFLCDDGKIAVKLLHSAKAEYYRQYEKQIAFVRRLAIDGLDLARPLALLSSPHIGYVMEYLTGMVPFAVLCTAPRANISKWYISTGGLRRRLEVLARIANSLQRLHSRGLCYGDPSPANIFISEDPRYSEVWMIDCDNLSYTSSPSYASFFTPRYGAPELVRGNAAFNTLTDAHAFAVMAFEALTLTHPLIGDAVTNKGPEFEIKALRGEMPWIESNEDLSNHSQHGITPRENVLSSKLMGICRETFEPGLRDVTKRPGLCEWQRLLEWAAASTVICHKCSGSFYRGSENCPWCRTVRAPYLLVTLFDILPEAKEMRKEIGAAFALAEASLPSGYAKPFGHISISEGESRILDDFHFDGGAHCQKRISLIYSKGLALIENLECELLYYVKEKKCMPIKKGAIEEIRLSPNGLSATVLYGNYLERHIGLKFSITGVQA